jgi:hypothetical protein
MSERLLRALLAVLGLLQITVGGWMLFATHSFGTTIAPFEGFNNHDLRDFASFYLALGLALLVAATRPTWRFPILVLGTLEYSFHTINHAIDVNNADPNWLGPTELIVVAAGTATFAWLAWVTAHSGSQSAGR